MKLYIAVNSAAESMGAVYHLRPDCAKVRDADMMEVTAGARENYAKTYGIRRICLRCRKAVRRAVV